MLAQLRKHFVEFMIVAVLLGGLLYAITKTHQTSVRLNFLETFFADKEREVDAQISALERKTQGDLKTVKKTLLLVMLKAKLPPAEIQQLFGSIGEIQELMDEIEGRPRRMLSERGSGPVC